MIATTRRKKLPIVDSAAAEDLGQVMLGKFRWNEHEVCENPEELPVLLPKVLKAKLTIMVASANDGWRASYDFQSSTQGSSGPVALRIPPQKTREAAIRDALSRIAAPSDWDSSKRNAFRKILDAWEASLNDRDDGSKKEAIEPVQTSTPPTPASAERYEPALPLDRITPSKTNPRKTFNDEQLVDLAESIKQKGVLEPILVRPTRSRLANNAAEQATVEAFGLDVPRFELVAGERRWRASKLAAMKTIPAIVRDMSDRDALEIQVIENLQRADVDPVEEADGYQRLIATYEYTPDSIAEKIGKSPSYVYGVLKLRNLPKTAVEAFREGRISQSTAQLIGRVPNEDLRAEAAEEICNDHNPMSFRDAKKYLERNFMRELKGAPFELKDATLLPAAGPCTTCPKRTGNSRALYPDGRADICTDPACFREKLAQHGRRQAEAAVAAGKKIVENSEKLFYDFHPAAGECEIRHDAAYVRLDDKCYAAEPALGGEDQDDLADGHSDNHVPTYRQLLGDEAAKLIEIAFDPVGAMHEVVPKKAAETILVEKKVLSPSRRSIDHVAQKQADAEKAKIRKEVFRRLQVAAADKAEGLVKKAELAKFLPALTIALIEEFWSEVIHAVISRRGVKSLQDAAGKMTGPELLGLLTELAIAKMSITDRSPANDLLSKLGLDRARVEKEVKKEMAVAKRKKGKDR